MANSRRNITPIEQYLRKNGIKPILITVFSALAILFVVTGAFTSFHTVNPEGRSVLKRFGRVIDIRGPGLHFKLPFNIDRAYFVPTERQLTEEFGFRTISTNGRTRYAKRPEHLDESLMLTGDLKVIDVEWVVQYRVYDADKYLHRVKDQDQSIRDISEAVMRRIVGNELGSDVLTEKRVHVAQMAREEIEEALQSFDLGVIVRRVELQDVTPPQRVKPAFNEVNQAEQERERLINEAEKRRSQVIPRAEGQAIQIVEEARAYATERINRARGETERFTAILEQYNNSPQVTRRRLYIEMIDKVLPELGNVYVVEDKGRQPLPLLNLDRETQNNLKEQK